MGPAKRRYTRRPADLTIAAAVRDHGDYRWVGVYEVTDTEVCLLGYAGPAAPAYPQRAPVVESLVSGGKR